MDITKHYIRTDADGFVIKGFSTAFVQPEDGDICINEAGGRHFQINGKTNPSLIDEEGYAIYKVVGGEIQLATKEEQTAVTLAKEVEVLTKEVDSEISRVEEDFADAIVGMGGTLPVYLQEKVGRKKAKRAELIAKKG